MSFEQRILALRAAYFVVLAAAAAYLAWAGELLAAGVVGVSGLLKVRPWLAQRLAAGRTLAQPWQPAAVGPFAVEVPPGWTAKPMGDDQGLQLDGPGALVQLLLWPHRETAGDAAVQALLSGVGEKVRLRSPRPCAGAIGGLAASGTTADVVTWSEAAVVEALAAHHTDEALVTMLTYRDVGLPVALLRRCTSAVTFTGRAHG